MAIDPATATVSAIWVVLIRVAVGGGELSISRCPGLLETGLSERLIAFPCE
jgi:hypothetical protein